MLSSSPIVHFGVRASVARSSWLPYFLAACSAGTAVADEDLLRYHWVMPEDKVESAPRVIRVLGEKGERYEEVFAEDTLAALKQNPAIQEAMIARQTALRKDALELARQLREAGKEPLVAYEEAWTHVYSRNWLSRGLLDGSCKLEDMLNRMASEGEEQELTEEERQWLLEALLEDDDRLVGEAGQELLRRLAAQLRKMGYGRAEHSLGANDELMKHFAEALQYLPDSRSAYREALFHTHRGRVMTHSLVGYRAPWGMGMGGGAHYRQTPQQVQTTEGSGNTQPPAQTAVTFGSGQQFTAPGLNELPDVNTDFLARAPELPDKKKALEDEEEEKDSVHPEETDADSETAAPAMLSLRSFSMRPMAYASRSAGADENAETPDSPVQDGGVQLASGESMDVGANRVTGGTSGGSLKNVQMLVTGELYRPVTKDYVTVHNLITSADGTNPGILTDVTLYAGTSTEYVTLHNITFDGQSELTGYITFEKTQTTGDISVAAGGTLTLENLTFDLRGVSMGEKTLIVIEDGGTLEGWNEKNVHFVYSGVKVNSAAVVFPKVDGKIVDGKIELSADHNGHLYWNGADDNMWNIGSVNWSSSEEKTVPETFTALSNVHFGEGGAEDREISVTQDMVVANLGVTDGGYSFKGARVAVLHDATFEHKEGAVTFNNMLVVQGGLQAEEGSGSVKLLGGATVVENAVFQNLSTTIGGDMTVGGMLKVSSGDAATAGSLTISGNVTAQDMEFAVSAGAASDSNSDYNKHLVNVSGNLTARDNGSITIGGTAAQYYTGSVTAGNLTVNTKEHDVYFSYLQVDKLTVGEGSTVHVRSSSDAVHVSSSVFPNVDLYGTLALDAPGVTYNDRHTVNVMSDAARLVFGEGCTIADLQIFGKQDNTGSSSYTDLLIEAMSRSATVTELRDLGTLKVETGTLTVKNAGGAVHGELFLNNGKLQLGENTNDIMAAGSGAVRLENGGILDIGSTTQTLYARNEEESLSLSGASTITGAADGGLSLGDGIIINYEDSGNSIETKLTAEKDFTLNSTLAGSSLEISGHISGSGEMELTGSGSVVLSSANTDFTGTVTVQKDSTLTLQNTDALLNAGVVLNEGATLALDAPDTVKLNALTLSSGSTLDISSIVGTDGLSAQDAALQVGTSNIGSNALTLNVHFADTLDTMTTYNIMSGLSSGNGLSLNVEHNGVKLDDSQYTLGVNNGVLYIYTMMGNVWDGGGSKIWSATGEFENWSNEKYNEDKDLGYTAAIFRDLIQTTEKVTVQGPVSPGDIYFTANETQYELVSNGSAGWLAAGTQIHKIGKADVSLDLAGNASADNALGDVNVRVGSLILESDLAVKGTVSVEKSAQLKVQGGSDGLNMVNEKGEVTYTASSVAPGVFASLSGVTMDAAGIRGTADMPGSAENLLVQGNAQLSYLNLTNLGTEGNVTLTNVTLMGTGSHALENVTIGQGVVVDASGVYTLSGDITFDSTLTNKGIITLDKVTSIEIGKLQHTPTFDAESGRVQYDYQLIKSEGNGSVTEHTHTSSHFTINGVNLDGGLIVDVDIDGTRHGALTLTVDNGNVGIPQWDEDWGKTENAPAFSRIYVGNTDYIELAKDSQYRYSSIVNETNAGKVNKGNDAIVVTLSSGTTGNYAVGGLVKEDRVTGDIYEWWHYVHNVELWIEDRSAIENIIGGLDFAVDKSWTETAQTAATHILVNSDIKNDPDSIAFYDPPKIGDRTIWAKQFIIGGSRWCSQTAESYVTVLDGEIYTIFGGSCGGYYLVDPGASWYFYCTSNQTGTSHVFIDGGRIGEIFAAGMYSNLTGTQMVEGHENKRAVEMVITGGSLGGHHLRVFGGGERGLVDGDIYIRMEGDAEIVSQLVGGSNAGTVHGNIEMDLISGYAFRVDAAGIGWGNVKEGLAYIDGDVQVNLYRAGTRFSTSDDIFQLGSVADIDPASRLIGGIYGGKETTNYVEITKPGAEIMLHFAESGRYELASIGSEGYETSAQSVVVTGFDRFKLENNAHVVLGLGLFDMDMDDPNDSIKPEALVISGEGVVEVIGHGIKYYVPIEDEYGNVKPEKEERDERNLGRNIRLEDSATLKISTSVIGLTGSADDRTITVTDGTTIDFSGVPGETGYTGDSAFAGLGFNVVIAGHGVEGQGAIYKGKNDDSWYPAAATFSPRSQRIILPNVELTSSASVKVVAGETLLMNNACELDGGTYAQGTAHLGLNKHTFTKLGAGDFIARSVKITPGTILVQQGGFGFDLTDDAAQTDMVLAAGGELKLNASGLKTGGATNLTLRSLSGAGAVKLNGSTLTLHTEADSPYYYGEYMTDEYRNDAQDYDQFSETTGFGYAVFSGMISDAKGGGKLVKTGTGVHYISGSSSTYTGGTQLQKGRLYLLGTSEASTFTKDTSKTAAGVAGRGTIEWASDAEDLSKLPELYLGHGARIYNKGTTDAQGGFMTIGVEGVVPNAVLEGFVVTQSGGGITVTMGGVEYVEIDTHNLKSIDVAAVYADGTAYAAGTDIDRNKMLLVKRSDWETAKDSPVTGFSATGYNEATYSGILADYSSSVAAGLHKVGVGTLELDQRNSYTGGTQVGAGTLRLRGWGTVGYGAVKVDKGASLMLAYNGGYDVDKTTTKDDETIRLSNKMTLSGAGDAQWTILPEEDESQAASGATHSATDGLTAALISTVGRSVTFTLSGNIEGDGGVLHSGEGTLVLCGDSSYTGGTVITRGVVDVQSAFGLGATAEGNSAVKLGKDADLHVTVEPGSGRGRLVTTLATVGDEILGDVSIAGSKYTERVLHMADNGYKATTTTLGEKGTFLLCGEPIDGQGISSHSGLLTGSGTVVVSDALGSGTTATFDTIKDYTGDFRVEGNNANIQVKTGSFIDGSIHVAGQQASVQIGGNVSISAGESLELRSMGKVPTQKETVGMGTGAVLVSKGEVSVAADAVLSVRRGETVYSYNLSDLEKAVSVTPTEIALPEESSASDYHKLGEDEDIPDYIPDYTGRFESRLAVNQQAVAGVKADVGLTLAGGCTYETFRGHLSLMGGSLKLDTLENNQLTFNTTLDYTWLNEGNVAQLVLFSDVSSVTFGLDQKVATKDTGVYYTRADRYLTGNEYIDSQTMLVYDSNVGVVYLQIKTPEPTTTTLGLVALAAMAARRRRKND